MIQILKNVSSDKKRMDGKIKTQIDGPSNVHQLTKVELILKVTIQKEAINSKWRSIVLFQMLITSLLISNNNRSRINWPYLINEAALADSLGIHLHWITLSTTRWTTLAWISRKTSLLESENQMKKWTDLYLIIIRWWVQLQKVVPLWTGRIIVTKTHRITNLRRRKVATKVKWGKPRIRYKYLAEACPIGPGSRTTVARSPLSICNIHQMSLMSLPTWTDSRKNH